MVVDYQCAGFHSRTGMVDAATRTCERSGRCWCVGNHGCTLAGRCYWVDELVVVGLTVGEGTPCKTGAFGVQQPHMVS